MTKLILSFGSHDDDSSECCLLEACSLPPGTLPGPGVERTDEPEDVCEIRAAFGRSLNDAYGMGPEADLERTQDLGPLVEALRGTSARPDKERAFRYLMERSLLDWYPRALTAKADFIAASYSTTPTVTLASKVRRVVDALKELGGRLPDMPISDLLVDFACRSVRAEIQVLAQTAEFILPYSTLESSACEARFADDFGNNIAEAAPRLLRGLIASGGEQTSREFDPHLQAFDVVRRQLRREAAEALLETCRW